MKQCDDPVSGSVAIIETAMRAGAHDNSTAMVLKFPGWDAHLPDLTREFLHRLNSDMPNDIPILQKVFRFGSIPCKRLRNALNFFVD